MWEGGIVVRDTLASAATLDIDIDAIDHVERSRDTDAEHALDDLPGTEGYRVRCRALVAWHRVPRVPHTGRAMIMMRNAPAGTRESLGLHTEWHLKHWQASSNQDAAHKEAVGLWACSAVPVAVVMEVLLDLGELGRGVVDLGLLGIPHRAQAIEDPKSLGDMVLSVVDDRGMGLRARVCHEIRSLVMVWIGRNYPREGGRVARYSGGTN